MGAAELWDQLVLTPVTQLVGADYAPFFLFVFGTQSLHMFTFWLHSGLYLALDMYPTYFKNLRKWKSQPDVFITKLQIQKAVKVALFNQFVVNIFMAVTFYFLFKWRGLHIDTATFPTGLTLLQDFVVYVAVEEVGFYYGHRIMHHPMLYAPIHKMHHEFTAPIGCAAIYAHPIEHALCNLLPLIMGPFLCESHLFSYWLLV